VGYQTVEADSHLDLDMVKDDIGDTAVQALVPVTRINARMENEANQAAGAFQLGRQCLDGGLDSLFLRLVVLFGPELENVSQLRNMLAGDVPKRESVSHNA